MYRSPRGRTNDSPGPFAPAREPTCRLAVTPGRHSDRGGWILRTRRRHRDLLRRNRWMDKLRIPAPAPRRGSARTAAARGPPATYASALRSRQNSTAQLSILHSHVSVWHTKWRPSCILQTAATNPARPHRRYGGRVLLHRADATRRAELTRPQPFPGWGRGATLARNASEK